MLEGEGHVAKEMEISYGGVGIVWLSKCSC